MTRARIQNPALIVSGVLDASQRLGARTKQAGTFTTPSWAACGVPAR
jgi:hypothetical protein